MYEDAWDHSWKEKKFGARSDIISTHTGHPNPQTSLKTLDLRVKSKLLTLENGLKRPKIAVVNKVSTYGHFQVSQGIDTMFGDVSVPNGSAKKAWGAWQKYKRPGVPVKSCKSPVKTLFLRLLKPFSPKKGPKRPKIAVANKVSTYGHFQVLQGIDTIFGDVSVPNGIAKKVWMHGKSLGAWQKVNRGNVQAKIQNNRDSFLDNPDYSTMPHAFSNALQYHIIRSNIHLSTRWQIVTCPFSKCSSPPLAECPNIWSFWPFLANVLCFQLLP